MASLELDLDDYHEGADGLPKRSYRDTKLYQIAKDFLQPNSDMSLETAADSLLELIPEHCCSGDIVGMICLCANVTPWQHTSHLKLAYLSERLRWSPKISEHLADIKGAAQSFLMNESFNDALWDEYDNAASYNPDDQSDLDQWMNFNAYLANLAALNFWSVGESLYVYRTMAYAFKHPEGQFDLYRDPKDETVGTNGRDANVIAAAQWILWDGQSVRRHALYRRPTGGAALSSELYFNLERAVTSPERWDLWKQGFKDASEEETASTECRDAASIAYALVEALEKCMSS